MAITGTITQIQKNGNKYDLSHRGLAQAIIDAQTAAMNAAAAAAASESIWAQNVHLTGLSNIPYFSASTNYNEYDLVLYKATGEEYPHIYRCLQTHTARAWDYNDWADTSVWGEIQNFKIGVYQYETVRLQLWLDGQGVLSKITGVTNVSVTVNGTTTTYQTDANGYVEFQVQRNLTYMISVADKTGCYAPSPQTHFANTSVRNIRMVYYTHRTGWYVVWTDTEGIHETYVTDWNIADNDKAVAVKFYCSYGHFAVLKNSPVRTSGLRWCVQNYQFKQYDDDNNPVLPNWNSTQARQDWRLVANTNNIIALADDPNTGYGITLGWTMDTSLFTYVPAARWARNQQIILDGSTYYGSLPTAGILSIFETAQNLTDLHTYLTMIGSTVLPALRSGYWWSSSQYSAQYAWLLNSGSLRSYYTKTDSYQVLPVFDF